MKLFDFRLASSVHEPWPSKDPYPKLKEQHADHVSGSGLRLRAQGLGFRALP